MKFQTSNKKCTLDPERAEQKVRRNECTLLAFGEGDKKENPADFGPGCAPFATESKLCGVYWIRTNDPRPVKAVL